MLTCHPQILAPVHTLFAAFWAAVASSTAPTPFTSALVHERARAGAAFLSALLECVVFVLRRGGGVYVAAPASEDPDQTHAGEKEVAEEAEDSGERDGPSLLVAQLRRAWGALSSVGGKGPQLQVEIRRAAGLLRKAVVGAGAIGDGVLFLSAFSDLSPY